MSPPYTKQKSKDKELGLDKHKGQLDQLSINQDEVIVKSAETVDLVVQQKAAYERITNAATTTREQLNRTIEQGHNQANCWFQVGLVAAIIGFLVILAGVGVAIVTVNFADGLLTSIASIVPNAVSILFFQQAKAANKRIDVYFTKLIEQEAINRAIELMLTSEHEDQERYKGQIISQLLNLKTKK